MMKVIFLSISVTAVTIFASISNFACSCNVWMSSSLTRMENAQQQAKVIFSGKVIKILKGDKSSLVRVKFKVDRVWKNELVQTIIIYTGRGGGDCGFDFQTGESYLVYAYVRKNNSLGASICTRTTEIAYAEEDLKILGAGKSIKREK